MAFSVLGVFLTALRGARALGGRLVCDVSKCSEPRSASQESQSLLGHVARSFHTQSLKPVFPRQDCSRRGGVSGSSCASHRPGSSRHEFHCVPLFDGICQYISRHGSADALMAASSTSSVFQMGGGACISTFT